MKQSNKNLVIFIAILIATNLITAGVVYELSKPKPGSSSSSSTAPTLKKSLNAKISQNNSSKTKTITVTGRIIKMQSDYYIVGSGDKAIALKLDFSQSGIANPNKLLASSVEPSNTSNTKGSVTVVGTYVKKTNSPSVILVKSINK